MHSSVGLKNFSGRGSMIKKSLETTDLKDGRENLAGLESFISLSLQLDCFLIGLIPDPCKFS